mmetsp:Transcript_28746/g.93911  ORF Transcript_28746/g.93911 Transcript_28746/m.93911 type:complete len:227 (-) Transcript_28746:2848-3528(-)
MSSIVAASYICFRSLKHAMDLAGTASDWRCVRSPIQYVLSLRSVSWRVRSVRRARSISRSCTRVVSSPRSTRSDAASASSILAGVDVTVSMNHPASSRSKCESSNETSYVSPSASRTVVNSRELITSVISASDTEAKSGWARRADDLVNGFLSVSSPLSSSSSVTTSTTAPALGSVPSRRSPFAPMPQRFGATPATYARARSSESLRKRLSLRSSSGTGMLGTMGR